MKGGKAGENTAREPGALVQIQFPAGGPKLFPGLKSILRGTCDRGNHFHLVCVKGESRVHCCRDLTMSNGERVALDK